MPSRKGRPATAGLAFAIFIISAHGQTLHKRPAEVPAAPPAAAPAPAPPALPVITKGTSLQVEIPKHYPMKAGESIEGRLLHPIYADGKLAVPAQTVVEGRMVALQPNRKARWQGRLRGDFTPYHKPEVEFESLRLAGQTIPIDAPMAADGAPVLHLSAAGAAPKRSLVGHYWAMGKQQLHDRIAFFTAPGKGDRLLQMLYHQLPYHPERMEAHTAWTIELAAPVTLPGFAPGAAQVAVATAPQTASPEIWSINAEMATGLTSATAKPGDPVQALVVEPVYDKEHQLVVPEGATLVGKVTTAKAARSLGRNGKLRFTFQQVHFPAGTTRPVQGALSGASVDKSQNLSLDAEGTVSPRNKASAVAPLLLTMLAGRALDTDGNMTANNGVASNGFGLVGRLVGVAAGDPNLAAGLGYYAAGLSFYENFLHSGQDVVFPKDTRVEIETTPLRAPVLKP